MNINKHILKTAATALIVSFSAALPAQVTLKEEAVDGHAMYRLENARLSLLIDPNTGGTVASCKDRLGGNVELIPKDKPTGLAIDLFQSQSWPGEMSNAAYKVVEVKPGAEQSSITLGYNVTGNYRGGTDEQIKGLVLEKTFVLTGNSPALQCRMRITAPKNESKFFAYWQQSIFYAGGSYDRTASHSFRPSVRGIRVKTKEDNGHLGPEPYIRDFTAGWTALLNTKTKSGMVVLSADYDDIDAVYSCSNYTAETLYYQHYLPAGKSVEYVNWFIPVAGLDNVISATPDYVAGYNLKENGSNGGEVAISVVRSINEPAPITFKLSMLSVLTPGTVKDVGRLDFPVSGTEPLTRSLTFPAVGADPLVMRGRAEVSPSKGEKQEYVFEDYHNGTYQWGENLQTDMVTPVYQGERPVQKVKLAKPAKIQLRHPGGVQIWYLQGILDNYYQMARGIKLMGDSGGNSDRNFVIRDYMSTDRIDGFPWDYDKLLSYDMIILGGAPREALGDTALEMLCDYLNAGGSMLVLGGPAAYGCSHFTGTKFADCLPVSFNDRPFGMERLDNAEIKVAAEAPFTANLDWQAGPRVEYIHNVTVKPWGKIVLQAGGKPFLVVGEKDGRRIACILGAPMGKMKQGQTAFWQWKDWPYLMRQVSWWLTKKDYRFEQKKP